MFVLWMLIVVGSAAIILVLALVVDSVIAEKPRVQVSLSNDGNAAPEGTNLAGSMADDKGTKRASA
jgi:hypothetical protein